MFITTTVIALVLTTTNVLANTIPPTGRPTGGFDFRLPDLTAAIAGIEPPCLGGSSLAPGHCRSSAACQQSGGFADGPCGLLDTAGRVCCVPPVVTCGGTILTNNTVWANRDYPNSNNDAADSVCSIRIQFPAANIRHIKLVFEQFEIAQPNNQGRCVQDKLEIEGLDRQVKGVLPVCGHGTGQHLHLPIRRDTDIVTLRIGFTGQLTGGRKWAIRVLFFDEHSPRIPPPGCRQYYDQDVEGQVVSFNYDLAQKRAHGTLAGLQFAACWRRLPGFCRVQIEANYFDLAPTIPIPTTELLPTDLSPCAHRDRLGLPPSSDGPSQVGTGLFCNRSFNSGRPYTIGDEPLIMYYESGLAPGQGYVLKYHYQLC